MTDRGQPTPGLGPSGWLTMGHRVLCSTEGIIFTYTLKKEKYTYISLHGILFGKTSICASCHHLTQLLFFPCMG